MRRQANLSYRGWREVNCLFLLLFYVCVSIHAFFLVGLWWPTGSLKVNTG